MLNDDSSYAVENILDELDISGKYWMFPVTHRIGSSLWVYDT